MSNHLTNLLFFCIAAGVLVLFVMVKPTIAIEKAESPPIQVPNTGDNITLPSEPHPGYYKYLDDCLNKIPPQCGEQIYLGIFKDRGTISTGCCNKLVDIGIKCHQSIVSTSIQILQPKPTKNETDKIYNKSYLVWSKCVDASMPDDDVEPPSTTPAYAF
ncbi:hypothetical protein ACH5RR_019507 [Cinchona calisaya]|uniref:Prolamin-like domain-containing protein n=1 Tax=Cinchona calisaya TaxID=153742 RepID=A0ABD2ZUT0_9GENT